VGAVPGDAAFLDHQDLIWSAAMTVWKRRAITSSMRLAVSAGRPAGPSARSPGRARRWPRSAGRPGASVRMAGAMGPQAFLSRQGRGALADLRVPAASSTRAVPAAQPAATEGPSAARSADASSSGPATTPGPRAGRAATRPASAVAAGDKRPASGTRRAGTSDVPGGGRCAGGVGGHVEVAGVPAAPQQHR